MWPWRVSVPDDIDGTEVTPLDLARAMRPPSASARLIMKHHIKKLMGLMMAYLKSAGRLLALYRTVKERMYAPGGKGYDACMTEFNQAAKRQRTEG